MLLFRGHDDFIFKYAFSSCIANMAKCLGVLGHVYKHSMHGSKWNIYGLPTGCCALVLSDARLRLVDLQEMVELLTTSDPMARLSSEADLFQLPWMQVSKACLFL